MKVTGFALLAALVTVSSYAKEASQPPVVAVCMNSMADDQIGSDDILNAQEKVTRIFHAVPVRIEWKSGRACQAADVIHVHLADWEHNQALLRSHGIRPELIARDALGFAYDATGVAIFYDRV